MRGFVNDIEAFYREMDAIAAPVTMGTGINVKTVQAMAHGMPLVATRWGTKGIETDDPMHNHADVESLVRGLLSLAENPNDLDRLAQVSRDRYRIFYEAASAGIAALFAHTKLTELREN
jgi:glycosyltransferase involved in cell wall biosynthesis